MLPPVVAGVDGSAQSLAAAEWAAREAALGGARPSSSTRLERAIPLLGGRGGNTPLGGAWADESCAGRRIGSVWGAPRCD